MVFYGCALGNAYRSDWLLISPNRAQAVVCPAPYPVLVAWVVVLLRVLLDLLACWMVQQAYDDLSGAD